MGFGAIAALAGAAISAGVSAAGSAGLFSGGGPNMGEYGSTLNSLANKYILPYANNQQFWNLDIPGMEQQSINFGLQNAPAINQFNMQQLQQMLNTALPGYQGMVNQMGANTASLLQGNIPTDVANQIQRGMAQQTLASGIGGGGGPMGTSLGAGLTTNAATARSLGLTSLGLEEQGGTQLNNLLSMTKNYLMPQPVNPLSLLPLNDLVSGAQWSKQAQYDASAAAYTAKANAAAARVGAPTNPVAGVTGAISGLNQSLQSPNFGGSGQSGYDLIGGLLSNFGGVGQGNYGVTANFPDDFAGFGIGGY